MAGNKQLLDEIVDLSAIEKQKDAVIASLSDIKKFIGTVGQIELKAKTGTTYTTARKNTDDLTKALKDQAKVQDEIAANARKLATIDNEQNRTLVEQKQLLKARNDEIKNGVREDQAAEGSLEQLRATLIRLTKEYDNLSRDQRQALGPELVKQINTVRAEVDELEQSTGRFQRNVGNYKQSFSSALSILETAFNDVKNKLDGLDKSVAKDEATVAALNKEYELLGHLLQSQEVGFASATQEVRNNEKALQALKAQGLEATEFYQALLKETAELKDGVGDLRNEIKHLGSDTKTLDGLIQSAQLLAGTYAIATESAQLFGISQEDAAEAQKKSQAILNILIGLQTIQNALQEESSAILFVQEVRLKAVAAAQYIWAAAMRVATAVTVTFAEAVAATGIGALVIALGLAVAKLIEFASAAKEAWDQTTRLTNALKAMYDTLEKLGDIAKEVNEEMIRGEKDLLEALEARQATEAEILAQRQKIAVQEHAIAVQRLRDSEALSSISGKQLTDQQLLQVSQTKIIALEHQREDALKKLSRAQALFAIRQKGDDKDAIKSAQTLLDEAQAQVDFIDGQLTPAQKAYNDVLTAQTGIIKVLGDQQKYLREEQAKALQTQRLALGEQADAAKEAADSEVSSYTDRIRALREYRKVQEQSVNNQKQEKLLDPSLSPQARIQIEKEAQAELVKIARQNEKDITALRVEEAKRRAAALVDIRRTELEENAKLNEAIADNEKQSFDARTTAAYKAFEDRIKILADQKRQELDNLKLTSEERAAIETKYAAQANDQLIEYGKRRLEIETQIQEQITAKIQKENEKRANIGKNAGLNDIRATYKAQLDGAISASKAEQEIARKRADLAIKAASSQVEVAQQAVAATKEGTAERLAAETELNEKVIALEEALLSKRTLLQQQNIANIEKGFAVANAVLSTIGDAIKAQTTARLNAIQTEEDAINNRLSAELAANEASTASTQEKADNAVLIQARADAQLAQLEQKKRQAQQKDAEFQKAISIIQIIQSTALAVTKALFEGGPFGIAHAIAVGALGAAQLAIAVATPIPQYAEGTDNHPGGLMITGDGGRKEVVQMPDGKTFLTPSVPTLMEAEAGTKVFPSVEAFEQSKQVAAQSDTVNMDMMRDMFRAQTMQMKAVENAIKLKPVAKVVNTAFGLRASFKNAYSDYTYLNRNLP